MKRIDDRRAMKGDRMGRRKKLLRLEFCKNFFQNSVVSRLWVFFLVFLDSLLGFLLLLLELSRFFVFISFLFSSKQLSVFISSFFIVCLASLFTLLVLSFFAPFVFSQFTLSHTHARDAFTEWRRL